MAPIVFVSDDPAFRINGTISSTGRFQININMDAAGNVIPLPHQRAKTIMLEANKGYLISAAEAKIDPINVYQSSGNTAGLIQQLSIDGPHIDAQQKTASIRLSVNGTLAGVVNIDILVHCSLEQA